MRLFLKLLDNNRIRLFIILIMTCSVSFLCLSFFNEFFPIFEKHEAFVRAGLIDKLIICFDDVSSSNHDRNKLNDIISDVKSLDAVNDFSTLLPREILLYDKSTNYAFVCDIYDQDFNENYQFELAEGRLPTKGTNEVLISEDGKSVYGIGDVIHTEILYYEQHNNDEGDADYSERKYSQPSELTIVGVLKNKSKIMSPYGCESPIDIFGRKVTESSEPDTPLIISYGCKDIDGNILKHDYGDPFEIQVLVVVLNKNYSSSEAKEQINKLIHNYGSVRSGYEIIEKDINSNWDIFRPYIVYGSVVLFLMIITMVSMYVFQIKRGMKALISYYICGSTWNNVIAKVCLMNIVVTLLGYVFGIVITEINNIPFKDYILLNSAKLVTLILILLIQIITSLIFFLSVYRLSPIEIKRHEDE